MRVAGNSTNLLEIVGVLADTRTDALTAAAEPEVYASFWQLGAFSKHLVVRTHGNPRSIALAVEKELRAIDPTVSVGEGYPLQIRHPITYSRTPVRSYSPPPRLGEHSDGVRRWLAQETHA